MHECVDWITPLCTWSLYLISIYPPPRQSPNRSTWADSTRDLSRVHSVVRCVVTFYAVFMQMLSGRLRTWKWEHNWSGQWNILSPQRRDIWAFQTPSFKSHPIVSTHISTVVPLRFYCLSVESAGQPPVGSAGWSLPPRLDCQPTVAWQLQW